MFGDQKLKWPLKYVYNLPCKHFYSHCSEKDHLNHQNDQPPADIGFIEINYWQLISRMHEINYVPTGVNINISMDA